MVVDKEISVIRERVANFGRPSACELPRRPLLSTSVERVRDYLLCAVGSS